VDSLACAAIKIWDRLGEQIMNLPNASSLKLFSASGIATLLREYLPILEDKEDAALTHDVLLRWALDQENSRRFVTPEMVVEIKRVFQSIAQKLPEEETEPEDERSLSFMTRKQGQWVKLIA